MTLDGPREQILGHLLLGGTQSALLLNVPNCPVGRYYYYYYIFFCWCFVFFHHFFFLIFSLLDVYPFHIICAKLFVSFFMCSCFSSNDFSEDFINILFHFFSSSNDHPSMWRIALNWYACGYCARRSREIEDETHAPMAVVMMKDPSWLTTNEAKTPRLKDGAHHKTRVYSAWFPQFPNKIFQ